MNDRTSYTPEEFQAAFARIYESAAAGRTPQERPKAFLLGGQPGAGKSALLKLFSGFLQYDAVTVSGDDYRQSHPRFQEILGQYGDSYVEKTQRFSSKMIEKMIEKCSAEGYNLIVEGTLRNAATPLKTGEILHGRGYEVNLAVIGTHPMVSYIGTLKRYVSMREAGSIPRETTKEQHDSTAGVIGKNIGIVYESGQMDNILIFDRDGRCLYNQKRTPQVNPRKVIEKIHGRDLGDKEVKQCLADLKYIKQCIDSGKGTVPQGVKAKSMEVKRLMEILNQFLVRER